MPILYLFAFHIYTFHQQLPQSGFHLSHFFNISVFSVRQTAIARLLPTLGKSNSVAGRPIAGKLKTNSWKLKRKQTFPKFGSFSLPVGICPGGFSFQSFVQFRVFFWNANPRILEIFAPPRNRPRMVASEKGIWGFGGFKHFVIFTPIWGNDPI